MGNVLTPTKNGENKRDLSSMLKSLDSECRNCAPSSPLQCISRCQVYKLKNELRSLREAMDNPNYIKELFNVLKNETRLHILKAIVNGKYSVSQLQQELKRNGRFHSQDTISEKYLRPLMAVGLANESLDKYYATTFGGRLTEVLEYFPEFAEMLPAHSECYEETVLRALLAGPKTFEEIEILVSSKIASRILKRLRSAGLIETPEERDYIFFFKSKRDPNKETFTETERKIYYSIPLEGISAGKLAKEAGLSLRRTYKYLRGLKGKKLVFVRRTPKAYGLTCKGEMLASVLEGLHEIIEDTWSSSKQVFSGSDIA
ncbi:MAG: ArsR family transcriptional regulator [Candidatus Bathyarchaeota archaeon]|nr:ArsR family transcriptional regulator [Candidatus Bathyarchaeota archaeon]